MNVTPVHLAATIGIAMLTAAPVAEAAGSGGFESANAAYRQNRVAEAEAGYRAVLADPAAGRLDRARSGRELGRIAWLIDRDLESSTARLIAAEGVGVEVCETAALHVRVLREAGHAQTAADTADRLAPACDRADQADDLRTAALMALADIAIADGPGRGQALERARRLAAGYSQAASTDLGAQSALLDLAIQGRDSAAAAKAWRGYFWLTDADAPPALAPFKGRVAGLFEAGLRPKAGAGDQLALLELLIRGGFEPIARRFAGETGLATRASADPRWIWAEAYFDALARIKAETLQVNRGLARGRAAPDYEPFVGGEVMRLAGTSDASAVRAILLERYGLFGTAGSTGGFPSLHMGHVVEDDRRAVEQHGRKGQVRFVVIDGIVANGFQSWLWDGSAAAGGWAEDGALIIQVRPRYTVGPASALNLVGDTPQRRELLSRIAGLAASDETVAAADPHAYLPGVAGRLRLQAVDQIAERARVDGGDFRAAFLDRWWKASVEQSIFIHEGRHVLDQAADKGAEGLGDTDLEERAKLSELILGDTPRLSLISSIFTDQIGGPSGHGRANLRIMQGLVRWMEAHCVDIAGYDKARPALLQLDKLTDAQIAAAARTMDPWTNPDVKEKAGVKPASTNPEPTSAPGS